MKKISFLIILLNLNLNLFSQETKQLLTNSAFDYVQKKEFDKAINCYSQLIQNDPKDSYSYFDRGIIKMKIDDYKGAINDFSQAIAINNLEPDYFLFKAKAESKIKLYKNAIKNLNEFIKIEAENSEVYHERGLNNVALKNYNAGMQDYNKAILYRANNYQAYSDRGLLKEKLNDLKGAISDYTIVIKKDSLNEITFLRRAKLYVKLKKLDAALLDCNKTLKINLNNLGAIALRKELLKKTLKSGVKKQIKINGKAQGTTYHITYIDNYERDFQYEIDKLLMDFDYSVSTYNPNSIITKVNNNIGVEVDKYFINCFNKAKEVWKNTDGAFDPTVLPLTNIWGFGPGKKSTIEKTKIDSILKFVGFDLIELKERKIIKKDPRVALDFNAFAQGYSVDIIAHFLDAKKIKSYSVEIGGEIFAKGVDLKNDFWKIAIEEPIDNKFSLNPTRAIVELNNKAISTSGNNRRYIIENGIKYAHHLDPRTGYPTKNNLLSASIIANDCISSDANATGVLVMGLEKAKLFLANHSELQAYLIYSDEQGNNKVYMTSGLNSILQEVQNKKSN